jgi:hypothetical protein
MGVAPVQPGRRGGLFPMPLTVFDCKGISATRRERIEAAVEAAGKHVAQPVRRPDRRGPFPGWCPGADHGAAGLRKDGHIRSRRTLGDDHGAGAGDPGRLTVPIPGAG